jgi:hypothetical protein
MAQQHNSAPKVAPEVLALVVELLPEIGSLRDLSAVTGLRLDLIRSITAPFRAIMKLQGTHPKCGCGKDRFHPYACVDSRAKIPRDPFPGRRRADLPKHLARRALIIDMLVAGERFVDIDRCIGSTNKAAHHYISSLTPEQMKARQAAVRRRKEAAIQTRPLREEA